jgi:hypothetical protein
MGPYILRGAGFPQPQWQGINFNSSMGKQCFSEPMVFPSYIPLLSGTGIYAILVPDAVWNPKPYRPIYFGETEDFSQRVSIAHERYGDWRREAGSAQLYVAQLWMFGSSKQGRTSIERGLIDAYKPTCNTLGLNLFSGLLGKSYRPLLGLPAAPPPSSQLNSLSALLAGLGTSATTYPVATPVILPKPWAVRIFTSFDYDHDESLRMLLMGQAKNSDTPFEIHDWSVKEPFAGDWKEKVRLKIRKVDQVIVICGEFTDTATGVNAELRIAREEGKPYFLLAGYKDKTCKKPLAALAQDQIYKWSWDNLKILIHGSR